MVDCINAKGFKIKLSFETQQSKNGRDFRLSGVSKKTTLPAKWINKDYKFHWVYNFIYLDKIGGFFEIEIDYSDNFVSLTTRS